MQQRVREVFEILDSKAQIIFSSPLSLAGRTTNRNKNAPRAMASSTRRSFSLTYGRWGTRPPRYVDTFHYLY